MSEAPFRKELAEIKEYIAGKNPDDFTIQKSGRPLIKLASNENPLGPSPKALAALQSVSFDISIYPDQNSTLLREALSEHFGLKPENVLVGNGSDEIMLMAGLAFLSAGEESIISKATFSIYEYVTTLLGGKSIFVDQQEGKYDLEGFQKNINSKTRLVWIANPNNPTGTYINADALKIFLRALPQGIIVILDEAYAEYAEATDFPHSIELLKEFRNLIVLRTFSKAYGLAGLRIGYALAEPSVVRILNKARLPFNVNRLAQAAGISALKDVEHLEQSRKNNSEGKLFLYSLLKEQKLEFYPTESNFICIQLPKGESADKAFMEFLRRGIIIRPLTSFGLPHSIRVTIGTVDQNEQFIKALKEI